MAFQTQGMQLLLYPRNIWFEEEIRGFLSSSHARTNHSTDHGKDHDRYKDQAPLTGSSLNIGGQKPSIPDQIVMRGMFASREAGNGKSQFGRWSAFGTHHFWWHRSPLMQWSQEKALVEALMEAKRRSSRDLRLLAANKFSKSSSGAYAAMQDQ